MYRNVKAEMVRMGMTAKMLATELDITMGTLSQKLNGKYPFTLNEAKKIKEILNSALPIEELFATEAV